MKVETREWVRLAEADFTAATALVRRRTPLMLNIVGFHCQQCVEKYLKAKLEEESLPVPKVHSLTALLGLLLPKAPLWAAFNASLLLLNNYAVKFRYPGPRRDAGGCPSGTEGVPFHPRGSATEPWFSQEMI